MSLFLGHAFDVGGFNQLKLIEASAKARSHETKFSGGNVALEEPLEELFDPRPDALIVGLSSFKNQQEITLIELARERNIPSFVVADTHSAGFRPPAQGKVGHATLFPASMLEADEAHAFGYGNVVWAGGPPTWQNLWKLDPIRLQASKLSVFVGGIKSPEITEEFLGVVVAGMKRWRGTNWSLVFGTHPAEDGLPKDPAAKAAEQARRMQDRQRQYFPDIELVEIPKGASGDVLAISTMMSFHTSGATGVVVSAMHRRPVAYYDSPSVRLRMLSQAGREVWWPCEIGAAWVVSSPEEIAGLMKEARLADLQARQEAAYPKPSPGAPNPADLIIEVIERSL